jgi:hypothetical protein
MVFSGDKLIFGIQLDIDELIKYIIEYTHKNNKVLYDKIQHDIEENDILNDGKRNKYYYFDKIVKQLNLTLELIKPPCCYFTDDDDTGDLSKVYLGVCLCYNNIVSRFSMNTFKSFDEYYEFYIGDVERTKQKIDVDKLKYIEDLNKILPSTIVNPKFYSMPNDCYICS